MVPEYPKADHRDLNLRIRPVIQFSQGKLASCQSGFQGLLAIVAVIPVDHLLRIAMLALERVPGSTADHMVN